MILKDKVYDNKVVNKPWGYEYLAYQNDNLAIWVLHLNYDQTTSLHCHTKKLTGLICLEGEVQVSFIGNSLTIKSMDKVMIRPTLFHSSKCLSKDGSIIIEIETPVDKDDLVRLKDFYGRENKSYESKENYRIRNYDDVWIDENTNCKISDVNFKVVQINNKKDLLEYKDSIFVILEGAFLNERDGRRQEVIHSGACLYSAIYKEIMPSITSVQNCKVLILEK